MPLAPGLILFIGDSITVGANCSGEGDYPNKTITLLNLRDGGGWTGTRWAGGGLSSWDFELGIDATLANATITPDYIFLYYGANDPYEADPDHMPIHLEEASWKAAYHHILTALHTKWADALIWMGKSYRCDSNGDTEPPYLNYIFPWTDYLYATYPYLRQGIKGYEILHDAYPDSMSDGVHPSCLGHTLLAQAIRDEMFPTTEAGSHRRIQMSGGMQSLAGGMNG